MGSDQSRTLRWAFATGAVTDAVAVLVMLVPPAAGLLWGVPSDSAGYRFAMGYGASLMLGSTLLLIWAYQQPIERRFVAALTVIVIYGLIAVELLAIVSGSAEPQRMVPTMCLQLVLLGLFASAYHYPALRRRTSA